MTDQEARAVVTLITSAPMIIGGISALIVNIGTLIVVIRGRKEIHAVKQIVDSRTDQLLHALEEKGEYKGMVKALGVDDRTGLALDVEGKAKKP